MTPEKPLGVIIKEGNNMFLIRFWIMCVFLYVVLVCLEFGRHMFLISDVFFLRQFSKYLVSIRRPLGGPNNYSQGICKILED